jgi:hypothetical protein
MSIPQNNNNQIDWRYIFILNELYRYIDAVTLREFRIISKFTRKKLSGKIFSKSYLLGEKIIYYFNIYNLDIEELEVLDSYSGYLMCPPRCFIDEDDIGSCLINTRRYGLSKKLVEEISEFRSYIKILEVKRLKECFYDLYSTVFSLSNLTQLELIICTVPLLPFLNIGNHFQSLQTLIFKSVTFIELSKQEISFDVANFPQSLEYVLIENMRVGRLNYVPGIDSLIHPQYTGGLVQDGNLQGIKIPNLKRLHVGDGSFSNFVGKLLKCNTKIEELIFEKFAIKQAVIEQLSLLKSLRKFKLYDLSPEFPHIACDTHLPIPELPSVTNLELRFKYLEFASDVKFFDISSYFPNLRELTIHLDSLNITEFDINNFISKNFLSFHNLDVFRIIDIPEDEVDYPYFVNFNWKNFVKIKCLILELNSLPLSKIDFNIFPDELKEIRKQFSMRELNEEYINNNRDLFKKWKVEFKGKFIYFRK